MCSAYCYCHGNCDQCKKRFDCYTADHVAVQNADEFKMLTNHDEKDCRLKGGYHRQEALHYRIGEHSHHHGHAH